MKKILKFLNNDDFFAFLMFFMWCFPLLMIPFGNKTYEIPDNYHRKVDDSTNKNEWKSVPHPVIVRHR